MSKGRDLKSFIKLIKDNGALCAYCENEFEIEQLTIDHINPICRGGSNKIENLTLACKSCNSSKGKKTLEEFRIHKSLKEVVPGSEVSFSNVSGLTIRTKITDLKLNREILQSIISRLALLEI